LEPHLVELESDDASPAATKLNHHGAAVLTGGRWATAMEVIMSDKERCLVSCKASSCDRKGLQRLNKERARES
jgi:hypothetical protein